MSKHDAQHAPAVDPRTGQVAPPTPGPVVAPAPGQVDALVASTTATRAPGLAVAPSMDLGDPLIGTRNNHELTPWNLDPNMQAHLQVRLEGHPSIMLTEAPEVLWPSTANNPKSIKLWFAPTSDAPVASTAVIRASWQMNARPAEEHRVRITGAGRQAFAPTRQQKVEAVEADKARDEAAVAAADSQRTLERRRADFFSQSDHEQGDGGLAELEMQRSLIQAALTSMANSRKSGIDGAKTLIANYKRIVPPPAEPSLLETLAWAALDKVTSGLGSMVVKEFKSAVGDRLMDGAEKAEHARRRKANEPALTTPATAVRDLVAGGAQALVSKGIKKATGALKGAVREDEVDVHQQGTSGADAVSQFFMLQDQVNWTGAAVPATQFSYDVLHSVIHMLPAERTRAVAIMKGVASAFDAASGSAHDSQLQSTVEHWMSYLAQSSMGSVTADKVKAQDGKAASDGATTTNMSAGNQAPDGRHPLRTFDGLVDLRFKIEQGQPLKKAERTSIMVRGVNPDAARILAKKPLVEWALPVRAVAEPTHGQAVAIPLTVLRDEAGNLSFTDNMHGPADSPSWLSRKAGAVRGSDEKQHEGARILLEQELLAQTLDPAVIKTDGVA